MNLPENLRYSKEHEWVKIEGDIATIGVTDFAQSELGDIVFIDINSEGETLDIDEIFGALEAVKTVSDLFMPVSGEIIEFNEGLNDKPDMVNKDPYGEGWMIKVRMSNPTQYDDLLDAVAYKAIIA